MAILRQFLIADPLADLAALKAFNTIAVDSGVRVIVKSMSPFGGEFVWVSTSTATPDDINVVLPTIHGVAGRWIRKDYLGLKLTAAGQIDASQLGIAGPFTPKGSLTIASDFPTLATVQTGWTYTVATEGLIDNDATKTNTGQTFHKGDMIYWYAAGVVKWVDITGIELFTDDGTDIKTVNARNIDLQNNGLKDTNVTTAIKLGSAIDTSFSTTKKSICGAINELLSTIGGLQASDIGNDSTIPGVTVADALNAILSGVGMEFWIKKTMTSSDILTASNVDITGVSSGGELAIEDVVVLTDAVGLATGTNFELLSNNVKSLPNIFVETVANLGGNKTVDMTNASITGMRTVLEVGKKLQVHSTALACTGAGTIEIYVKFQRLAAGATISPL
jgi:hypothetical protein